MGAGLAKKIADKWPEVKEDYLVYCQIADPQDLIGGWIRIEIPTRQTGDFPNRLFVVSIFGQLDYGRKPGHCYTSYRALATAMHGIRRANKAFEFACPELPVYFPHGLGCGLAGGDWHVVSALIQQELPDAIICRWDSMQELANQAQQLNMRYE